MLLPYALQTINTVNWQVGSGQLSFKRPSYIYIYHVSNRRSHEIKKRPCITPEKGYVETTHVIQQA